MPLFIRIPNSCRVIDKFGTTVITFKTPASAVAFENSDGADFDPNEIESITQATDEDRLAAGITLNASMPFNQGANSEESLEKVKVRAKLISLKKIFEETHPGSSITLKF